MPKVKDALGYLEQVKQKFQTQPHVYNQFLDIMKDFKSKAIDTEGVIKRVKTLFKGNRKLILGFNQFLPREYRIEMPPEKPQQVVKHTIEFNHAVQYVAKIKDRFRNQPQIYGEFLEILHDYQEKKAITEVYQRVQNLFGNQPDLLAEFKDFLPDNSQSKSRPKKKKDRASEKSGKSSSKRRSKKDSNEVQHETVAASAPIISPKSKSGKTPVTFPPDTDRELAVFEKLKSSLPKAVWCNFIDVLHMWSKKIITRREMMMLVENVLDTKYSDLFEKFKEVLEYDDWFESRISVQEKDNFYAFVQNIETMKNVVKPTRSYRQLPASLPMPPCTARTPLCDAVLNDMCISVPSGSEDFSFKSTRKNQFEENLFKCEDDRFELDMVIENNASTIRVLEPIAKQLADLSTEDAKGYELPDTVDILHIRSISRIYGEHGYEVIELLKTSPATCIPVILQRLKQKDEEWRRVRMAMRHTWRKTVEANYHKSLDHRSFYFKQEDKRRLGSKTIISNLYDTHDKVFGAPGDEAKEENGVDEKKEEAPPSHSNNVPFYTYCQRWKFDDVDVHRDVLRIMKHVAVRDHNDEDREQVYAFWGSFVQQFFGVQLDDEEITAAAARESESKDNGSSTSSTGESSTSTNNATDANGNSMDVETTANTDTPKPAANGIIGSGSAAAAAGPTGPVPGGEVKPLRVMMETWELEEKLYPIRRHNRPSRLFFGNKEYYVFFCLYHYLYDRLRTARKLAAKYKPRGLTASSLKKRTTKRKRKRRPEPKDAAGATEQFYQIVIEFIDGSIESAKFEDDCRSLLGANSYVLYTIDRLVGNFMKQVLSLVNDETSLKLLKLYQYEFSRHREIQNVTVEQSAQLARMYQSNCVSLISDDRCIQMEFFEDAHELGVGVTSGHNAADGLGSKSVTEEWSTYMKEYLDPTKSTIGPNEIDFEHTQPFLLRNVRDFPGDGEAALQNVSQFNGLEAKFNMRTLKAYYVDTTEDWLIRRRGHPAGTGVKKAKVANYKEWYVSRMKEIDPEFDPSAPHGFAPPASLLQQLAGASEGPSGSAGDDGSGDHGQMMSDIDAENALAAMEVEAHGAPSPGGDAMDEDDDDQDNQSGTADMNSQATSPQQDVSTPTDGASASNGAASQGVLNTSVQGGNTNAGAGNPTQ